MSIEIELRGGIADGERRTLDEFTDIYRVPVPAGRPVGIYPPTHTAGQLHYVYRWDGIKLDPLHFVFERIAD